MESGYDGRRRDHGGRRHARVFPRLREQLGDALHRVIGQTSNEIDEVRLRVDTGEPAVFHHGEEIGQPRSGFRMADLQPVLRAELERADRLLDEIIFDPGARFAQTAQQLRAAA